MLTLLLRLVRALYPCERDDKSEMSQIPMVPLAKQTTNPVTREQKLARTWLSAETVGFPPSICSSAGKSNGSATTISPKQLQATEGCNRNCFNLIQSCLSQKKLQNHNTLLQISEVKLALTKTAGTFSFIYKCLAVRWGEPIPTGAALACWKVTTWLIREKMHQLPGILITWALRGLHWPC